MKRWRITRWQSLAVWCVVLLVGSAVGVWQLQKSGGACHESHSYACNLITPKNLPTDYLVLTGIGGIFVAIFTLKSIHHQAIQMRKQTKLLISKERARLDIDLKPLKLDIRAVAGKTVRLVEFTVSIYGATAATILDSGMASGIFMKGQENDPDLGSAVMFRINGLPRLIPPNKPSLELVTFLFFEGNEAAVLEAIQKEDEVVVVRGFVRYQDVFDTVRTLRFRYYWGPLFEGFNALGLAGFSPNVSHGHWIKCGPSEDNQENLN